MRNIDRLGMLSYSKRMKYIQMFLPIIMAAVLVISCASGPETQPGNTGGPTVNRNETFDPARVSQEYYVSTRVEVQQFIEGLNQIIRSRNYNAWRAALSPEHFAEISSPQNLREISELPAMKTRNIILRTPQDYFTHVVVPSRANSRVDDIEFISMNRVKAFTITTNRAGEEVRLRLYDLEKINNTWTIIN